MYKYTYMLLKIAVDTYSKANDKNIKYLANYYSHLIDKLNNNNLTLEELEQIKELYKRGYKQESFTNCDIENINNELEELNTSILERIN